MIPLFSGKAKNGELVMSQSLSLREYLFSLEGESLDVAIEEHKSKRSLSQLAYLWVIYGYIAETTGHSAPEVHEIAKRLYLTPQIIKWQGKDIKIPGSTTKLNVSEMSEFIEKVKVMAGELGIVVPEPQQVTL